MGLKERITEAAEQIYDVTRKKKYNVELNVLKAKSGETPKVKISTDRETKHNIKWRSKNY